MAVEIILGGRTMTREKRVRRDIETSAKDGDKGLRQFFEEFGEALASDRDMRRRFSFRRLLEELIPGGREIVDSWNPEYGGSGALRMPSEDTLLEDGSAVTSGMFGTITNQIVYTEVMEAFDDEAFVFSDIVRNVPTKFNGERIPGIGRMGNVAEIIGESKPYPRVGLSEDYRDTPTTEKRGLMIDLTREAIFFDRTSLLIDRASELGRWLGYNKEIRLIDAFIDENETRHRYNWKGTQYATYQTSTPWDNVTASATLTDWTDLDEARQTLGAILDPNTGTPILNIASDLVVCDQLLTTAERIVNATEIRFGDGASSTTQTVGPNPAKKLRIISSQLLAARMATDTTWFYGDVAGTIEYMENFPLQVEPAPANTGDMWERDIAMSWKAGERGAAVVKEPRKTTKCTVGA